MTVASEGTSRKGAALVSAVFSAGDEGKAEDADLQPVSRMTAVPTAVKRQRSGGREADGEEQGGLETLGLHLTESI